MLFRREPPSSPAWVDYHAQKKWETLLIILGFGVVIAFIGWIIGWHHVLGGILAGFTGILTAFGLWSHLPRDIQAMKAHPDSGNPFQKPITQMVRPAPAAHSVSPVHAIPTLITPHVALWIVSLLLIGAACTLALVLVYRYPPNPPSYTPDEGAPRATLGGRRAYSGTLWGVVATLALGLIFHGFLWPRGWWSFPLGVWVHWGEAAGDVALLFVGAVLTSRAYWRLWRRARTVWDEIVFYQDDQIAPVDYIGVIDNVYEVIQARSPLYNTHWWYRLWVGQNTWSINILRSPERPDPTRLTFLLAGPDPAMRRVEQALAVRYSNLRFWRSAPPAFHPWRYLLRWGLKYRTALHVIRLVSRDPIIPFDNVVQTLSVANTDNGHEPLPIFIQLLMTPIATGWARRRVQRAVNMARWSEMHAESEAGQQMLSQIGNGRWRTEWRAAADHYDLLARLTGAWAFESKYAEIVPRNVLTFRHLTREWMTTHLPKPWPLLRGPVLWSSEIAAVFMMPTGQTRVDDLHRLMTRRMPVPLAVRRGEDSAIVEGETNVPTDPWVKVGLHEGDRHKNVLIRGIQGAGKSNTEIHLFRSDVNAKKPNGEYLKTVVLIDIGKDTAQACLEMVPPDRRVIWFSPNEEANGWMLQPFASSSDYSAQVDQTLQMLMDSFGEDSIQARSKQILSQALRAVLEARGAAASPSDLLAMLTKDRFRQEVLAEVHTQEVKDFWLHEFEEGRATNPGFWEEALAAPRNKLDALLRHARVKAAMDYTTARDQMREVIDWDAVIERGDVVIMNIDKTMGSEATRMFGIAGLLGLWYALQRQIKRPEDQRRKVSVIIDEAQNFLSPTFTTIMAEGRAMGLEMTVAVRFLEEIKDKVIQQALINLCQNQIVYRINRDEEARSLMYQAQRLYHNNITLAEDVMAMTNFSADDFMHLPDHQAICLWQAQGNVQMPFNVRTLDWRPYRHPEWAEWHRAHQPQASVGRGQAPAQREGQAPATTTTDAQPTATDPASRPAIEWVKAVTQEMAVTQDVSATTPEAGAQASALAASPADTTEPTEPGVQTPSVPGPTDAYRRMMEAAQARINATRQATATPPVAEPAPPSPEPGIEPSPTAEVERSSGRPPETVTRASTEDVHSPAAPSDDWPDDEDLEVEDVTLVSPQATGVQRPPTPPAAEASGDLPEALAQVIRQFGLSERSVLNWKRRNHHDDDAWIAETLARLMPALPKATRNIMIDPVLSREWKNRSQAMDKT